MRLNPSPLNTTTLKPMLLMKAVSKYCGIILLLGSVTLGGCTAPSSGPPEASSSATDSVETIASPDSTETEEGTETDNSNDDTTSVATEVTSEEASVEEESTNETTDSQSTPESDPNEEEAQSEPESASIFIAEDHLDSFLYQYYDLINQRQYQQAWTKLGPDMQTNSPYDSYVEWWDSIRRVDVQSINHVYAGESGGEVMVLVSYDKGNKAIAQDVLVMSIGHVSPDSEETEEDTHNSDQGDWQIRSVDVAKSISPQQTQDATPITPTSSLVIDGIGPIRVGMTLQEAANATGFPMATRGIYDSEACDYYEAIGSPSGISFMVSDGRIVRVDIDTETITTPSGAGIGSSTDDIKALYPGKIEASGHKYVPDGQYLRFVPTDAADQAYRILFETDADGKVTRFRSGFVEEVGYVEGCS